MYPIGTLIPRPFPRVSGSGHWALTGASTCARGGGRGTAEQEPGPAGDDQDHGPERLQVQPGGGARAGGDVVRLRIPDQPAGVRVREIACDRDHEREHPDEPEREQGGTTSLTGGTV